MGRHQHTLAHVDRRAKNNQRIADVCEIRDDAVRLGLQETTERWKPRYDVEWIEDVVFYRIHKSILEGSCQYDVDGD